MPMCASAAGMRLAFGRRKEGAVARFEADARQNETGASHRARNALAIAGVGAVWLALDIATKGFFNGGAFAVGQHIAGPFLGLFRFTLVHNTGGAWGLFSDSTIALGVVSLAVSVLLVAFALWEPHATLGQAIGAALVAAGGVGNAIDRFVQGYVVDFIEFTFIDFPVFNIADIGVTCGLVLLVLSTLLAWRKESV